jgi:glycosyltransferase involved in cell wall biosynthesis
MRGSVIDHSPEPGNPISSEQFPDVALAERTAAAGIVVVAPSTKSQGGVAAVVANIERGSFWGEFNCRAFSSTADLNSRPIKFLYALCQWGRFLIMLLRAQKPLAASIHTSHGASFWRKFAYVVACRIFGIPVVLHIHPALFVEFSREGGLARRAAIRLAGRFSDQIVVLSNSIRLELSDTFPASKIKVLPNPVDLRTYKAAQQAAKAEHPHVLFMGWIVAAKGVFDLVEAIPDVLSEFPDAAFLFAGNKEVLRLETTLANRGLTKSCKVLGWVDGQSKLDLLHSSWMLVLPSYTEGLPNVILEAMACQLPIVTTPVGAIPSVVRNGESAIFVEPGDIEGIGRAIKGLIRDGELRRSLASEAFKRVRAQYSVEVVDEGLRTIYSRYR